MGSKAAIDRCTVSRVLLLPVDFAERMTSYGTPIAPGSVANNMFLCPVNDVIIAASLLWQ